MKKTRLIAVVAFLTTCLWATLALATGSKTVLPAPDGWWAGALAAGLGIAIAAFGGVLAQGRAAAAALDGIARNPSASGKIQTPMIIGLALIESLVIYAFVIAIIIAGKLPNLAALYTGKF